MYALIKYSSGFTLFYVNILKSYVLKSTIGTGKPLNVPSPLKMKFSENLIYNPKEESKPLLRIISYLLLVDLDT